MGWSDGSRAMLAAIEAIRPVVSDEDTRVEMYRTIFEELRDMDWDTTDEALGEDPAYDRLHEEYFGESEDDFAVEWFEDSEESDEA